jgi:Fe-Mn family superoxide dismutase
MKVKLIILLLLVMNTNQEIFAQFVQAPLPYAYNALEPAIDAQTMEIHYTKHHAAYVANLNAGLKAEGKESHTDLLKILNNISGYSAAVRNNGGGHYNHDLFWSVLTTDKSKQQSAVVFQAIEKTFGSMDNFKAEFLKAAATRFGSGWAWLVVTADKKLVVCSNPNQDNPLMDIAEVKGTPILGVDVWEHAYYLKYQNKRADYLSAFWDIINWQEVERRYEEAMK